MLSSFEGSFNTLLTRLLVKVALNYFLYLSFRLKNSPPSSFPRTKLIRGLETSNRRMVVFVSSAFLLDTHKILHLCFAAFFAIYTVAFLQSTKAEASSFPNVALNKATFQGPGTRVTNRSVVDPSVYTSQKAVDGNNSTNRLDCTATDTDFSPDITIQWWLVDLGAPYYIHMVALLNRENFHDRLQNFTVDLFLEDPRMGSGFPKTLGTICGNRTAPVGQGQWAEFTCQSGPVLGRFVRVVKWFKRWLSLCEVRRKI